MFDDILSTEYNNITDEHLMCSYHNTSLSFIHVCMWKAMSFCCCLFFLCVFFCIFFFLYIFFFFFFFFLFFFVSLITYPNFAIE